MNKIIPFLVLLLPVFCWGQNRIGSASFGLGQLSIDWTDVSNTPEQLPIGCLNGHVAMFNGSTWTCLDTTGFYSSGGGTITGTVYNFFSEDGAEYVQYPNGDIKFKWQPPIDIITNDSVVTNTTTNRNNAAGQIIAQNVTIPTDGEYDIYLSLSYNGDANTSDCRVWFDFDNAPIATNPAGNSDIIRQEMKDSAGIAGSTGSNQILNFNKTWTKTLAAGSKAILLQVYSEAAGVESSVWNTRLEIKRRK